MLSIHYSTFTNLTLLRCDDYAIYVPNRPLGLVQTCGENTEIGDYLLILFISSQIIIRDKTDDVHSFFCYSKTVLIFFG